MAPLSIPAAFVHLALYLLTLHCSCDHNKYTMDYLLTLGQTKAKRSHAEMDAEEEDMEGSDGELKQAVDSDSDELDLEELMS